MSSIADLPVVINENEPTEEVVFSLVPKPEGLPVEKAASIQNSFGVKISELDAIKKVYQNILTKEITEEVCQEARKLRLEAVKVRRSTDKLHKVEKEVFRTAGLFCDALRNKVKNGCEDLETPLQKIEDHFVNLEKERLEKVLEIRSAMVLELGGSVLPNLEHLDDETFSIIISGLETKKKLAEEAETQRLLDIENERLENIRLDELKSKRYNELKVYHYLIGNFVDLDLKNMDDVEYDKILSNAKKAKTADDFVKEKSKLQNDRFIEIHGLKEFYDFGDSTKLSDIKKDKFEKMITEAKAAKKKHDDEILLISNRKIELAKFISKEEIEKLDLKVSQAEFNKISNRLEKAKKIKDAEDAKILLQKQKDIEAENSKKKLEEEAKLELLKKDDERILVWLEKFSIPEIDTNGMSEKSKNRVNFIKTTFSELLILSKKG